MIPRATVRLQFRREFTLAHARDLVPYFSRLGISHIYASPLTRARPGSSHGYDVTDPTVISEELGGEAALEHLASRLREFGMGLILDIVPNHMAAHPDNRWWWSVLEMGRQSPCASWFDIQWECGDPALRQKVLAPFLDEPFEQALGHGKISLQYRPAIQSFQIEGGGGRYPVAPGTLRAGAADIPKTLADHDARRPGGRRNLRDLLHRQHYRLAGWQCAARRINWRRFFEINELIGLRSERQAVFDAVHALPLRLYRQGLIDGVRVDHIDGLAWPGAYCRRLRAALQQESRSRPGKYRGDTPYLIVEKILAHDEHLPDDWPVDGTTGYDFMEQVGALLTDPAAEQPLATLWRDMSGDARTLGAVERDARVRMLTRHFRAEYKTLLRALRDVAAIRAEPQAGGRAALPRALRALLTVFPVYRSYADENGRSPADARRLDQTLAHARALLRAAGRSPNAVGRLDGWLGGEPPRTAPKTEVALRMNAIRRFQQLTPPLAAKSLEDTAFYQYGRLISRNEVGAGPDVFALSPEAFHQHCRRRAARAPAALLATATHDHKRGEDTRARIAVLGQITGIWAAEVGRWMAGHAGPANPAPHPADRYMLYQTLVGAYPLDLMQNETDGAQSYIDRVAQWQIKALREAKTRSGWTAPDTEYERRCDTFLRSLMAAVGDEPPALREIGDFARRIAPAGIVNSLAQTLLHATAPGVPDLYQGTEFWDFSLVDPDNRRPVDFQARIAALDLPAGACRPGPLLADWRSGRIKQAVLRQALLFRRSAPCLFAHGDYTGLRLSGTRADCAIAFLRSDARHCALVIAPRLAASISVSGEEQPIIEESFWADTAVTLPDRYTGAIFENIFSGARHAARADGALNVADLLSELPVALLRTD